MHHFIISIKKCFKNSMIKYKPNALENLNHDLHTEIHMGIPLDLINQKKYDIPDDVDSLEMNPKDEELLRDDSTTPKFSRRSEKHSKSIPWLRRTEYLISGFNKTSRNDGSFARKTKLLAGDLPSRDEQIEIIKETFKKPEISTHHTKPDIKPVKIMDLVPDIENWGHSCALVIFDQHPIENGSKMAFQNGQKNNQSNSNNSQISKLPHAIMKGIVDSNTNDRFVAYFLPDNNTMNALKTSKYMQNRCFYHLHKKYHWNLKNKESKGFEPHLFISEKDGRMYYNDVSILIQLGRRKFKAGSSNFQKSTLAVKYGPMTQAELQAQEKKLESMRPCSKEFEIHGHSAEYSDVGDDVEMSRVIESTRMDVDETIDKSAIIERDVNKDEIGADEEIKDEDIFGSDFDDEEDE